MLTHPLRRVLAALASVLLILGLVGWTSSPSQAADDSTIEVVGHVQRQSYETPLDVAVRFYKSTGDADQPWVLAADTRENERSGGYYSVELAPGTYRATFNELEEDTLFWRVFQPKTWTKGDEVAGTTEFEVSEAIRGTSPVISIGTTTLKLRGGKVTGRATDQCYGGARSIRVVAYAADDDELAHPWVQWVADPYDVKTFGVPTKFNVTGPQYADTWLGGDSFATATTFTQTPGTSAAGPDLDLVRVFNESQSSTISGKVVNLYGSAMPGIVVRAYRSESGSDGSWVLAGQTTTMSSGESYQIGTYAIPVDKQGIYRVTFNEMGESKLHAAAFLGGTTLETAANVCADGTSSGYVRETKLLRSGGKITGKITNHRGSPTSDVLVEAFDANGSPDAEPVVTTTTDGSGFYSLDATATPLKLRFSAPAWLIGEWSGDADDFASATSISAAVGETSSGNDAVLDDAPLAFTSRTTITGKPLYGSTLTANPGRTTIQHGTSYRWMRTKNGVTTPISGATSYNYTLKSADTGARISVRVTASPLPNYPGITAVSSTSAQTATVKRRTYVWTYASTPGMKVKVSATIKVKGLTNPDGRVKVSLVRLVRKGDYLYATGATRSRWLTYKDGHISSTFSVSRKGYWGYGVYVASTSTRLPVERWQAVYVS